MLFHVNPSSGVPIYAQIEIQVKNAIAAGAVKQGHALPSVRKLAAELGINPTTPHARIRIWSAMASSPPFQVAAHTSQKMSRAF